MHTMPVLLDCNFVVDSTNGNGLGLRSLKGPTIMNVYMHTTATPAPGNPNPAAGTILIQLMDNYNRSLSGFDARISPVSGTPLTATTSGTAYIIVSLGTATRSQWQAVGLPKGITPAVGVSFVATSSATIGGSAAVETTAAAGTGISTIETVGDPNLSINPDPTKSQGYGAYFILQTRNYSGAVTAPADGSVLSIAMYLSNSSIQVQGE